MGLYFLGHSLHTHFSQAYVNSYWLVVFPSSSIFQTNIWWWVLCQMSGGPIGYSHVLHTSVCSPVFRSESLCHLVSQIHNLMHRVPCLSFLSSSLLFSGVITHSRQHSHGFSLSYIKDSYYTFCLLFSILKTVFPSHILCSLFGYFGQRDKNNLYSKYRSQPYFI